MTRLILTSFSIPDFIESGFADLAVDFYFRFVWGQLPPLDELAISYLGPRAPDHRRGHHWSSSARWGQSKNKRYSNSELAEFCERYETVELWFDMDPNAQLMLVWLLDYFRSHPKAAGRLRLRLFDFEMIFLEKIGKQLPPVVDVTATELATASAAWQAYQSPTPEACFNLLSKDLSALPLLRSALTDLFNELPSSPTGLGATEMRMLEMIGRGYSSTNALFHLRKARGTYIFNELECGYLLEGLAHGPVPAVAGLDDELRTIARENLRDRHRAFLRSRVSLTEFGKAVVAHQENFGEHNPIDRWWGGTRLTNDRLWRWNPVLVAP